METIRAFASHIISPYHRAGILSFLGHFALPSRHVAATIYIDSGNWRKNLLQEGQLRENHFSAEFKDEVLPFGVIDLLKAAYALLFMRNKAEPDCLVIGHSRVNLKLIAGLFAKGLLTLKSRIATVVIDEGIGTYAGLAYRYQAFCRENKPGIPGKLLYCLIYPANQHILKSRYLIDHDWRLIRRGAFGKLSLNNIAISCYRDTFRKDSSHGAAEDDRPDILLITQPLVELGLVTPSCYQDILSRLKNIASAAGLSVMVKCHPAEGQAVYGEYGFKVIESSSTAESIISQLRPHLVLGFSSTALVNSSIMFSVKSHSILKLLPGSTELTEQLFKDTNIRHIYTEYVNFITEWPELQEVLARLPGTAPGKEKLQQASKAMHF